MEYLLTLLVVVVLTMVAMVAHRRLTGLARWGLVALVVLGIVVLAVTVGELSSWQQISLLVAMVAVTGSGSKLVPAGQSVS